MKSGRRFSLSAILAFLIAICLAVPQLAQAAEARVPHNAFDKVLRPDLAAPLSAQGEIRVVVGLQTADEIARPADTTPDADKAAAVSARQSRLLERLAGRNVRNVTRLRLHHFIAMTVDKDALEALLADPEVTSVTEDRQVYPILYDTPGITRADKAWAEGFRGAGQTVAIIDTGVDKTHPFFSGKVVAEACYSNPMGSNTSYCPGGVPSSTAPGSGVPCPDYNLVCWHGTHVAGIATGRTGVLTATTGGIAPDANVIPIQVFQRTCSGTNCSITAYDSDIIAALDHVYALRTTYNIASANLSLGGDLFTATCDSSFPGYKTVIDSLRSANIATVIASGNNSSASSITAPGCISSAISVGSTNKDNTISSFSNSASFLSLLAPGGSVTSSVPLAYISGGFLTASGTSMATPHVAGAWAVLKSAQPTATVSAVLSALQNTGLPITDPRNGITKSLIQIGDTTTQVGAVGSLLGNVPPTITLTAPANNAMLTAPATVNLSATAADSNGTVSKLEFYRDTTLIATVTTPSSGTTSSGTWTYSDSGLAVGTYSYTAKAYDNATPSAVTTSAAVLVSVTATTTSSVNVAAQSNGGVASASSTYSACCNYGAAGANNGDRKGLNWGSGGGWNDGTAGSYPDWLQITFSGVQSIGEIDVFTVQDNFAAPVDPTSSMTFTQYGITAFEVQYWNGSAWVDVPGGNVTGNNLVWRRFTFTPISTSAIRVLVNSALSNYSRIVEVEAWTVTSGGGNTPPTITLTAPANNAMLTAPATVNLSATAADSNGTVSKVEFYRDTTLIATVITPSSGTQSSGTWTYSDPNVAVGNYTYTAKAYDNATPSAVTTSAAVLVSVTATTASSVNVAAQSNGGVASASSTYSACCNYGAAGANNGDRKGLNWGSGGGWNDATAGSYPDWLQITFSGVQSIGEIDVFTVQDNFSAPVDPTSSMTFTQYGITAFEVQYWNGSAWVDVPGGNVTGNNLVWRRFTFTPISTSAIRVLVNSALASYSRIVEVEAWTATPTAPPTVNVAAQSNGGVASASSTYSACCDFGVAGANNGDRKGLNWGSGGGWNDATAGSYPDWLQITFSGAQNIGEIDVFTVQDNFSAPVDPTSSMTFTQYGITAFQVQYLNGTAWVDVPGGNVTGNNLVWRRFTFTPISTSAIRVLVNSALANYSRIVEVEAWTAP